MENVKNTPEFAQSQEPRLPKISPKYFESLNLLDGFMAKAPLTRQEHATANQCFQNLMMGIESLEASVASLRAEVMALQQQSSDSSQAKDMVDGAFAAMDKKSNR